MGSCSSEQHNTKGLDATVGRLVWVRRGNGSWWPGQIMDVDELSDGCLDVQKSSGVPIKLLGRDDVTVDWYNLEKTKKVKAFRCGDHDSCIEKAKASLVNPSKKRVKHAPRENAIILALELESASMSKDCDNNCSGADNSDSEPRGSWSKASLSLSHPSGDMDLLSRNTSSSKDNSDSAPELSHSGISFEEANATAALPDGHPAKVKRQKTPNDSEDDGNEGLKKRMKGLDDLGVGSNMKELNGLVTESAPQCLPSLSDLCASNRLAIRNLANGSRGGSMPSFKKKRSKMVFQDILKRKNRRRMLTKVFQSDTLVSVPIMYDELPTPHRSSYNNCKVSGVESNESNKSPSKAILCNDSISLSPGVNCENAPLKNASEDAQDVAPASSKLKDGDPSSTFGLLGYDSSENLFDVPLISEEELSDGFPLIPCSSLKTHVDPSDLHFYQNIPVEVGVLRNEARQEYGSTSSETNQFCYLPQKAEKGPAEWQLKGKRNSRNQNKIPESDSKRPGELKDDSMADVADPDDQPDKFSPIHHKPFPYRQSRFSVLPRYEIPDPSIRGMYEDSILYDVQIEVKASYRPQHVPYISLMSKLNGKPITGHPIAVEVLEDGECDLLIDIPGLYPTSGSCELDDDELKETQKHSSKKKLMLQPNVSPSMSPKTKKPCFSTKKTRTLSSLTRPNGKLVSNLKDRKLVVQTLKAPALACIPLKVVFSRITEALNGSTRAVSRGS